MSVIETRYRDVDRSEYLCPHMTPARSLDEVLKAWAEIRGTSVVINTADFVKGDCDKCDRFGYAQNRSIVAFRSQLEIGD